MRNLHTLFTNVAHIGKKFWFNDEQWTIVSVDGRCFTLYAKTSDDRVKGFAFGDVYALPLN
jgi:hypothetical protein